jgi:hypothetical protein
VITTIGNRHLAKLLIASVRYGLEHCAHAFDATVLASLYASALNEVERAEAVRAIETSPEPLDGLNAKAWRDLRDQLVAMGDPSE